GRWSTPASTSGRSSGCGRCSTSWRRCCRSRSRQTEQTALSPPTKENRRGGLRRAGTAGSACRSTCGRETGDSGDRRALRLGQPALPAAPAHRRPPRRLSVGRLKACCVDGTHRAVVLDCMRVFLALSFLATTLSATTFFDPPNPTSATPVTAHVTIPPTLCTPTGAAAVRNGSTISITLSFPHCPLSPPGVVPFHSAVSLGVLPAGVYDVVANGGLDRGTLVVRDAASPFEVVPNVVPTTGGEVHLRSNDP